MGVDKGTLVAVIVGIVLIAITVAGLREFVRHTEQWQIIRRGRKLYRTSTAGSQKWNAGHRAGCVFYASDDRCICNEVLAEARGGTERSET